LNRASAIAVCHNHPSGNKRPSHADDAVTLKLKEAAQIMNIRLIDHIIITGDSYYSYSDEGRI
jgi:DNA repair protein RadC